MCLRRFHPFQPLVTRTATATNFKALSCSSPKPTTIFLFSVSSSSSFPGTCYSSKRTFFSNTRTVHIISRISGNKNKNNTNKKGQDDAEYDADVDDPVPVDHVDITNPVPSELIKRKSFLEALPRYPHYHSVEGCLRGLDYFGTCAFAISGSLLAATYGLNATGCTVVGAATALGGGALRDIIFGTLPVSFIDEYEYIVMALGCAALTFLVCLFYAPSPQHMERYDTAMFWLDSIGLGAFCVIGTMYATSRNLPLILVLLSCVVTCTGGGVMRDLAVRRRIRVFNNYCEAYAETVMAGCLMYVALRSAKVPVGIRAVSAWFTVLTCRYLSTHYNFSLPQATALRSRFSPPMDH